MNGCLFVTVDHEVLPPKRAGQVHAFFLLTHFLFISSYPLLIVWKRLMLADGPRQVINATILYQTFRGRKIGFGANSIFDWNAIFHNDTLKMITVSGMIFTVFMFAFSLIMLLAAVILYIPVVSHIRGNLKEYCCHKIDKR
jgi:hypothetical protein